MKKIYEYLNKTSKSKIIIVVLTGVLLLIITMPTTSKTSDNENQKDKLQADTQNTYQDYEKYEEYLENKLQNILSQVEGVGGVKVSVSLKRTSEKILATDMQKEEANVAETDSTGGQRNSSQTNTNKTNIFYDCGDSSIPYVITENMPEIEGIIVVAGGGGDGNICSDITQAVEALLGIPAHKIKVMKMNVK